MEISLLSSAAYSLISLPLFSSKSELNCIETNLESGLYALDGPEVGEMKHDEFWRNYFYFHFCFDDLNMATFLEHSHFIVDFLTCIYADPTLIMNDTSAFSGDQTLFFTLDYPPVDPRNPLLFVPGNQNDALLRFKSWKDACMYLAHFEVEGSSNPNFLAEKFFFGILYSNYDKMKRKHLLQNLKPFEDKTNGLLANGLINSLIALINHPYKDKLVRVRGGAARLPLGAPPGFAGTSTDELVINFQYLLKLFRTYEAKLICKNTGGENTIKREQVLMSYLIQNGNIEKIKSIFDSGKQDEIFTYFERSNTNIFTTVYKYNKIPVLEAFLNGYINNELFNNFLPTFNYDIFLRRIKEEQPLLKEPPRMRKLIEDRQAELARD